MNTRSDVAEHREIWLQIPWYVNDSIDTQQRERVEAHARECAACRGEIAQQRGIHGVMSADSGVEHLPVASLKRLRQRLDAAPPNAVPGLVVPDVSYRPSRRLMLAAAVAAVSVTAAILVIAGRPPSGAAGMNYYTVSDGAPRPPQEAIRAVFAPDTTLARLEELLAASHLRIVSGPTEAGVYSLALTGQRPVAEVLAQLRRQPDVRFAESTLPATAGEAR
jgi:anti-sigma factor RsiW